MRRQALFAKWKQGNWQASSWRWGLVFGALGFLGWIGWEICKQSPPGPSASARPLDGTTTVARASIMPAPAAPPTKSNQVSNARGVQPPANVVPPSIVPDAKRTNAFSERVMAAQVALARQGISPGPVDGKLGYQTRAAVRAFQRKARLPVTGGLDAATEAALASEEPVITEQAATAEDLARLLPLSTTWLGKSEQARLDYETILELVAESSQAHPQLIRQLNPDVDWEAVKAGTVIRRPNVVSPPGASKGAVIKIFLGERMLEVFDQETNLVAHFPCSIAQRMDKRPLGELHVAVMAPNPNYTFDPEIFPESEEGRQLGRKLMLPAGPNNPVGTVWIGLDRPGYGIHGTPRPEQVGRTESHGCFRLANWNAEYLLKLAWPGMPVVVEP